jgi:hypothetical protein
MEAGVHPVASKVPATVLMWLSFGLGSAGFIVAGARNEGAVESLHTVTAVVVGGVGVVSFFRHAVFARSDAARMGWSGEGGSNFQLEVGFANLAFGLAALSAHFEDWGTGAEVATTLGYGLYLLQAALLHMSNAVFRGERAKSRIFVGIVLSFGIAAGLIYTALNAAEAASLGPF